MLKYGSRRQVFNGKALQTTGKLKKGQLIQNSRGKIVSKTKSVQAKKSSNLKGFVQGKNTRFDKYRQDHIKSTSIQKSKEKSKLARAKLIRKLRKQQKEMRALRPKTKRIKKKPSQIPSKLMRKRNR